MEHGPFEDVFPIQNEVIVASHASLPQGNQFLVSTTELFSILLQVREIYWKSLGGRDRRVVRFTGRGHPKMASAEARFVVGVSFGKEKSRENLRN